MVKEDSPAKNLEKAGKVQDSAAATYIAVSIAGKEVEDAPGTVK